MTELEKVQSVVAKLNRAEKAQVLEWIVRDLGEAFPGIDANPSVAGGEPCIVRTRIPIWTLVRARQLGSTEAELLHSFPTLHAEDLVHAWSYYQSHRDEIEQQIRDNEAA